jgi:uncharacterized phage-like protein YoqJ
MILGMTGHRTIINYNATYLAFQNILNELKPEYTICGVAVGADQLFAVICIRLGIPFIAAVPFVGQECKWPEHVQKQYKKILTNAKEVIIVSDGDYSNQKFHIRNEWIVDHSDKLLAYYDGSVRSGTGNCYNYAKKINKEIIRINPKNLND